MENDLLERLRPSGVRFVRIGWCDNAGVIRAKAVHIGGLASILEHGVGITAASLAMPVMSDAVVPGAGVGPVGEIRLVPDWSTLRPLPYAPGHARVLGDMILDGKPWALCPRGFLRRMAAQLAGQGLELRAAFESEFCLVRRGPGGIEPADDTLFAATLSMDRNQEFIDAFTDALLEQGVPVEMYYPESAPGQQEVSIRYAAVPGAADRHVVFRETARAVALKHGLIASFLPKIYPNQAGSGAHLNLSLWRDGNNATPDPARPGGLSAVASGFVAGILDHLPALMALTVPSCNSYRRIRPHFWSGAFRCWGPDNREAAVRVPTSPDGRGSGRWELKTVDNSCNPYLALGAVIAAGLDGLERGLELPEAMNQDPGDLPEGERTARAIDALPADLGTAIAALEADVVLRAALGEDLARAFLAVRRAEWEKLGSAELADEVSLLLERY